MRLILAHGWGYGPSFWQKLCDALPDYDPLLLDFGYSGDPVFDDPSLPGQQVGVAIGHSLGVARLLDWSAAWMASGRVLPWRAFIACCGLSRFCRDDAFPQGIDGMVIEAMQARMRAGQGARILAGFHAGCGEDDPPDGPWDAQRLDDDLSYLAFCDTRQALAALPCPVLVLAARDDQIITPPMIEAGFSAVSVVWSDHGGHSLPRSRPRWCADQIKTFIHHQGGV